MHVPRNRPIPSAQAIPKRCRVHCQLINFPLLLPAWFWVLLSLTSCLARNVLYLVASENGNNAGLSRRKLKRLKLHWPPLASAPINMPRNAESERIPAKARRFEIFLVSMLAPEEGSEMITVCLGFLPVSPAGIVRASSVFPILSTILLLLGGLCVGAGRIYSSKNNIILSAGILFVAAGMFSLNRVLKKCLFKLKRTVEKLVGNSLPLVLSWIKGTSNITLGKFLKTKICSAIHPFQKSFSFS